MSEGLWDIPESWAWSTLGFIAEWASGGTPKSTEPKFYNGDIPWLVIGDLNDRLVTSSAKTITSLGLENSSAKMVQKGAILIAMYGSIGKLGIAGIECATNQAIAFTESVHPELEVKYLFYFLLNARSRLNEVGKGGAQQNISQTVLKDFPICIAPLHEQRRIVTKVEKLLSRMDAAQARLATIPRILKRFRQSVLAAACSGRLTTGWRKEQTDAISAEVIVASLFEKRRSEAETPNEESRLQTIYEYKEENSSEGLPEYWKFVALGKLCETFDYGTSAKSQSSGLIPVLRMGNIQNGEIDWSDLVYTSDDVEITKYRLEPRTVLFNRTNSPELVGKTAIYRGEQPAIFAGYLIRVNNYDVLDSAYLNYCLNTNYAKEYCLSVKTDGVSQSNINAQKLAKFEVPFCPLSEQQEIVRRVEVLFKTADALEARYRTAKAHVDKLTQSILARAFRGELVTTEAELARQEGRDYESASVLLERIQQERAQQQESAKPKAKRTNRGKKDNATKKMFA